MIGLNGAGKTMLFNLSSGYYYPTRGRIIFEGKDITHLRPSGIAKRGLVRPFQGVAVFKNFRVLRNVIIRWHLHSNEAEQKAAGLLQLVGIADLKARLVSDLAFGIP